jgi:hypothetical protein
VTELPYLTFGELLDLPAMGVLSVLDFSCTLEASIERTLANATGVEGETAANREAQVSATLLGVLEEPWVDWVSERDPRFEDLLPQGKGTLAERIDGLTSSPEASPEALESLAEAIPRVRARIANAESEPLETSIAGYLHAVGGVEGNRLRALAARLHWHGERRAKTLEEAGAIAGVTRERVRQLQGRFLRRHPPHPVVMPTLDKALALLAARAPLDAKDASEIPMKEGLSGCSFHPASLIAVARACGRTPSIHVEQVCGVEMVVASPIGAIADKVARVAYRQASACGASNVLEVTAEIAAQDGSELADERVRELLTSYSDVEFLEGQWFWCPRRPHDGVRTISRKILSVTAPVDVTTLREGIRRAFQFRQSIARKRGALLAVPPRSVLLAYYRAHPEFVLLDGGFVKPTRPLDYRAELGGIEQALVDVLRSASAHVLDRASLAEGCLERGVNPNSLWTMTSYSPVMEHLGTGLWTLRGTRVDPAAVEAIRRTNALRPREKRVLDFGWAPSGHLWVAIRLPADPESHVFGIPTAVKRYLTDRDFQASTQDGAPCGRIRVYDYGASTGYADFLRRAGADEGDLMLARFDLAAATVVLALTDDDSLEELSPEV